MPQQHTYKSPTQNSDTNKDREKEKEKDANTASTEFGNQISEARGAIKDEKVFSDKTSPTWQKEEAKDTMKDPTPSSAANSAGMWKAPDYKAADYKAADYKAADYKAADYRAADTKDKAGDARDKAADAKDVVVSKAVEVKDVVAETAIAVKDKAVEAKDKALAVEQVVTEKAVELKDEAVEKLAEAKDVVVETLDDAGEKAKRWSREAWRFTSANAFPLAMIGIGTGLLFANAKRSTGEPPSPRLAKQYDYEDELDEEDLYAGSDVAGAQRPSQPRERGNARRSGKPIAARTGSIPRDRSAAPSTSHLKEQASGLASQASDAALTAKQKLEDGAAQTSDFVRRNLAQGTDYVRRGVSRATDATKTFADANPIALGMATLAVGVGIGMILPSSDRETKLLQPLREQFDRFVGDARDAASDVAQVARETANDSLNALT